MLSQMGTELLALRGCELVHRLQDLVQRYVRLMHSLLSYRVYIFRKYVDRRVYIFLNQDFLGVFFFNWTIRHHCSQSFMRMVCWFCPLQVSQGFSSLQGLATPKFSPKLHANCCLVAFCCYFSEIGVKRKEIYFWHVCLCQKEGNGNMPEGQDFLIPGQWPQ